jgi:hypothetical protein
MGNELGVVPTDSNFSLIEAGDHHSIALRDDGSIYGGITV